MTPSVWRDGGRGETIRWTHFDSPLGRMLIAATSKGICRLTFDDSEESLRRLFPKAEIVKDDSGLKELIEGALEAIERPLAMPDLPIDVAGTAFQEAVWRELRQRDELQIVHADALVEFVQLARLLHVSLAQHAETVALHLVLLQSLNRLDQPFPSPTAFLVVAIQIVEFLGATLEAETACPPLALH